MKVRIKVFEYSDMSQKFYVQVKNNWYSCWETLSEDGRSADRTRIHFYNQSLLDETSRCYYPDFGTYAFASEHARQVVLQELEERHPELVKTFYLEAEGC